MAADTYYYTFELRNDEEVRKYFYNQAITRENEKQILDTARTLIIEDLNNNNKNLRSYKETKVIIKPYRQIRPNIKDYIFIDGDPIHYIPPQMSGLMFRCPYDEAKEMKKKSFKTDALVE